MKLCEVAEHNLRIDYYVLSEPGDEEGEPDWELEKTSIVPALGDIFMSVARLNEISRAELIKLIKSKRWQGGEYEVTGPQQITFESDVEMWTYTLQTSRQYQPRM